MGLECHIKPLKLALLSIFSQTQKKSNCVIYLIADENVGFFFMGMGGLYSTKKVDLFIFFQIHFLPGRSWPC